MIAHLRPSAPTASSALLCGDPARALAIAQRILVQPRMSNHHRGLWGYHGETPSGEELTVQSTGIGGPSAVVVLGELVALGVRRAIRVGTCVATADGPPAGASLVVERAVAADGTSAALGYEPGGAVEPDARLTAALLRCGAGSGAAVLSQDIYIGAGRPDPVAVIEDLQSAAVLAYASRAGLAAAAVLTVAVADRRRLEDEPLEAALLRSADKAVTALSRPSSSTRA